MQPLSILPRGVKVFLTILEVLGWKDGSLGRALVTQVWGLESRAPDMKYKSRAGMVPCLSSAALMRWTGYSPGQAVLTLSESVRHLPSVNRVECSWGDIPAYTCAHTHEHTHTYGRKFSGNWWDVSANKGPLLQAWQSKLDVGKEWSSFCPVSSHLRRRAPPHMWIVRKSYLVFGIYQLWGNNSENKENVNIIEQIVQTLAVFWWFHQSMCGGVSWHTPGEQLTSALKITELWGHWREKKMCLPLMRSSGLGLSFAFWVCYSWLHNKWYANLVTLVNICSRYFSVAVWKHSGQKQPVEERVYFGLWFQRDESPSRQGGMAASAGTALRAGSWELVALELKPRIP